MEEISRLLREQRLAARELAEWKEEDLRLDRELFGKWLSSVVEETHVWAVAAQLELEVAVVVLVKGFSAAGFGRTTVRYLRVCFVAL